MNVYDVTKASDARFFCCWTKRARAGDQNLGGFLCIYFTSLAPFRLLFYLSVLCWPSATHSSSSWENFLRFDVIHVDERLSCAPTSHHLLLFGVFPDNLCTLLLIPPGFWKGKRWEKHWSIWVLLRLCILGAWDYKNSPRGEKLILYCTHMLQKRKALGFLGLTTFGELARAHLYSVVARLGAQWKIVYVKSMCQIGLWSLCEDFYVRYSSLSPLSILLYKKVKPILESYTESKKYILGSKNRNTFLHPEIPRARICCSFFAIIILREP